jgi:hypothetical protein
VARYIKKHKALNSLGPSEERGAGLWIGYDIRGTDGDLQSLGLVRVDDWSDSALADRGVRSFTVVAEDDEMMRSKLGLGRLSS